MPKSRLAKIVAGLALLLLAVQVYRPDRTNPVSDPSAAIDAGARVPAQVVAILKRSCYDCHSHATRWPWYSNVAPMSWGVANHVADGRAEFNFSTWNTIPARTRIKKLDAMCDEVREGKMPLSSYLLLHQDAGMSEPDRRVVCDWSAGESARLGAQAAAAALPTFSPLASHGGLVYVSGILPGEAPGVDDVKSQAARVLDELRTRLTKAGSGLDRVVSTTVYLRRAEDFGAMNQVWATYWPAQPPTRTTVIADLPSSSALIQVSAIAAAAGASRDVVQPAAWVTSPSPYSYAIRSGDTLFLAGLVARRGTDNTPVAGDITIQTRTVLDNARAILAAAGFTFADVVSARVFLTNTSFFEQMNETYRTAFPQNPPARATVRTGLMSPDYLVEITFTAVKGPARTALTTPNADGSSATHNPNLSSAIGIGPRLFLSGMLGMLPGNAADAVSQTRETLARLQRTLAAGGAAWPDVVDSVVYVTDMAQAPAVLEAFRANTARPLPVGTVVGAGLVSPDGRVEIMLTAEK